MTNRVRLGRRVLAILFALVVGATGTAGPVSAADFQFNPWPWLSLIEKGRHFIPTIGEYGDVLPIPQAQLDYGSDGRMTVLLVGSDWRERLVGFGERADTMMVVSVNPNTHQMSMLSIPRDVGRVPIAPRVEYKSKINGLFKSYKKALGTREAALEAMRAGFEYTLDIEIDHVAYIRFDGFEKLVDDVGGVYVSHDSDIYDTGIVDERTNRPRGAKFLAGDEILMRGASAPHCYGTNPPGQWARVPDCRRALLYVRTRHGPGNNDWVRARRQQDFLLAAIPRVTTANLDGVGASARSMPIDFYTTLPIASHTDLLALYDLLSPIDPAVAEHVVLRPPVYASHLPGTSKQVLNLDVVRAWTREFMGPVD